jgi:hypothetical protein
VEQPRRVSSCVPHDLLPRPRRRMVEPFEVRPQAERSSPPLCRLSQEKGRTIAAARGLSKVADFWAKMLFQMSCRPCDNLAAHHAPPRFFAASDRGERKNARIDALRDPTETRIEFSHSLQGSRTIGLLDTLQKPSNRGSPPRNVSSWITLQSSRIAGSAPASWLIASRTAYATFIICT